MGYRDLLARIALEISQSTWDESCRNGGARGREKGYAG